MKEVAAAIIGRRDELARAVVEAQFARVPALYARYGQAGQDKCVDDVRFHLTCLAEAVGVASPDLFRSHMVWVKSLFGGLGISTTGLTDNLAIMRDVLGERLGRTAADAVAGCIAHALAGLAEAPADPPRHIDPQAPYGTLAQDFLDALLTTDRRRAMALVMDAVAAGAPVRDIYLHVFQPVLREAGRLWQIDRITVAHEHFVTAATQAAMSMLYPHIFAAGRCGRTMMATCVSGELHEVGVRMVADFFEMAGWDTTYLGANMPAGAVVRAVEEQKPDVLAISTTITAHVGSVADLIGAVRAVAPRERPLWIIVGGYPFNLVPDLWEKVGADACAADAVEAVDAVNRLMAGT
jgi:methanogenic corrinoid protein MtbC1